MNQKLLEDLLDKALSRKITFPQIVAAMKEQKIESYHVDFLRNEYRYYSTNGESFILPAPLIHDEVAETFSKERIDIINRQVQTGEAGYPEFVKAGTAAGCAYYVVYIHGQKVRYFGRNGDEYIQHFPTPRKETLMKTIARSKVKSVDIAASINRTFNFLADPMNWPQYAVVNLRAVRPGQNGWFKATTKFGEGEIKTHPFREFGIVDHTWKDPQAHWTVYTRIVPNGEGCTVMMTLFQPTVMTNAQFDQAMSEMDVEMAKLKEVLESA